MSHSDPVADKKTDSSNQVKTVIFKKGLKYLALSLPLLFFSPIVITVGFKMISKGAGFWMLVLGCLLAVLTIGLVTQAFRLILKSLFAK